MTRGDARDADAARLDGEDLVDRRALEQAGPFGTHGIEELHIALVVQERIDLENAAALHDAVAADAILELFHDQLLCPVRLAGAPSN